MYYRPRDDYARPAMGTSIADNVDRPGGSNEPQTEYTFGPTAGPRVLPVRVRRQILIDAASGQAMADDANSRLGRDLDDHLARRQQAMGIAVGAHAALDEPAGYVGGRRMGPAANRLGYLFGVDGSARR